jgi:hypothetical protein
MAPPSCTSLNQSPLENGGAKLYIAKSLAEEIETTFPDIKLQTPLDTNEVQSP